MPTVSNLLMLIATLLRLSTFVDFVLATPVNNDSNNTLANDPRPLQCECPWAGKSHGNNRCIILSGSQIDPKWGWGGDVSTAVSTYLHYYGTCPM